MTQQEQWQPRIRQTRLEARLSPGGEGSFVALQLSLAEPIPSAQLQELQRELLAASEQPLPGLWGPAEVQSQGEQLTLVLPSFDGQALSLEQLLGVLERSQNPLGMPLIVWLLEQICLRLAPLHQGDRAHGNLHEGSVIVGSSGGIALLGRAYGPTQKLFKALFPHTAQPSQSPTVALDVFCLAQIIYRLVSAKAWPASLSQAQQDLERLSQSSAPQEKAQLAQLALRCLAGNQGMSNSLQVLELLQQIKSQQLQTADHQLLAQVMRDTIPLDCPRGPASILLPQPTPEPVPAPAIKAAEVPPAQALASLELKPQEEAKAQEEHDWGEVLPDNAGQAAEAPTAQPTPKLSLPKPEQPKAAPKLSLPAAPALQQLSKPTRPAANLESSGKTAGALGQWVAALLCLVVLSGGIYGIYVSRSSLDEPEYIPDETTAEPEMAQKPAPAAPQEKEVPPKPQAPAKPAKASVEKEEAKPLGFLSVMSKPQGADVFLNDRFVGKTPLVLKHKFEHRGYRVRVNKKGYQEWKRMLTPSGPGGNLTTTAVLLKEN